MGNERQYNPKGGFNEHLYDDHPAWTALNINGVRGKVITYVYDSKGIHTKLPTYSDTSDMYFRVDKTGKVIQAKLYLNRRQCIDFDWGHQHRNKGDGRVFEKGTVHVQTYSVLSDGSTRRNSEARYMSNEEIEKYGALIRAFNPEVKFRP